MTQAMPRSSIDSCARLKISLLAMAIASRTFSAGVPSGRASRLQNDVPGDCRGDFPAGGAADAVDHAEDAASRVEDRQIFIVGARAAGIGPSRPLQQFRGQRPGVTHGHAPGQETPASRQMRRAPPGIRNARGTARSRSRSRLGRRRLEMNDERIRELDPGRRSERLFGTRPERPVRAGHCRGNRCAVDERSPGAEVLDEEAGDLRA